MILEEEFVFKKSQSENSTDGIMGKELLEELKLKSQLLELFTAPTFVNLMNVCILLRIQILYSTLSPSKRPSLLEKLKASLLLKF